MAAVSWAILVVAVVLAGAGTALFVYHALFRAEQARHGRRARTAIAGTDGQSAFTAAAVSAASEGRFIPWVLGTKFGGGVRADLIAAGMTQPAGDYVRKILWSSALAALAALLFTQRVLPALVVFVAFIAIARAWLANAVERRLERMQAQLPDALTLISNSLGSGLSLTQALQYAAAETEQPLGPELKGLVQSVAGGKSLLEALDEFREYVPIKELRTVSAALEIQHRAGGNIRDVLIQATDAVRQSIELRMSLRAQTAQGKLSARVVGIMPIGILGVLSLISSDYVSAFFSTPIGVFVFVTALVLDFVGYMLVQRIIAIEV